MLHLPGIEPRASAWKALMLPLHHRCLFHYLNKHYNIYIITLHPINQKMHADYSHIYRFSNALTSSSMEVFHAHFADLSLHVNMVHISLYLQTWGASVVRPHVSSFHHSTCSRLSSLFFQ